MWFRWFIVVVFILANASCSTKPTRRIVAAPTETATVLVRGDGKIYFNDRAVSFDQLKVEFARLKQIRGAVSFFNQSSPGTAQEQAQLVKKAIIEAELPMRVR